MTKLQINLSSRPFVNYSLYHLGYVVIGLTGLLLLAHNAIWFFSNHSDVRKMEGEIAALQTEVDDNISEAMSLAEQIDQIQRNRRFREVVNFVESRIRQRRFSWIRMLNLLQEAIPPDVKIESITPRVQENSIRITLACMARREDKVNEFIENLEAIDEFDRVLITAEDREGSTVSFPLTMEYSPKGFGADQGPAAGVEQDAAREGDLDGAEQAPEPGSLAEAISRAEFPDPETPGFDFSNREAVPDGGISDPFAVAGDDPFADAEVIDEENFTIPWPASESAGDSGPESGAPKSGTRNSGDLIKKPPRKPGDRQNRPRPPGPRPGGRC